VRGTLLRGVRLNFYTPRLRSTVQRSRAPHHSCLTTPQLSHARQSEANSRRMLWVPAVRISDVGCVMLPTKSRAVDGP
jgi:hypothetical protein